MTLGTGAPFNVPAKEPNYTYKDAIILVSDGLNTQNPWYSNASQIDARQRTLCDNAKAAGITIYTMHINTGSPADPVSVVLQYCARLPSPLIVRMHPGRSSIEAKRLLRFVPVKTPNNIRIF